MKCPQCHREQPMSFKCRACGAELMRRPAGGQSPRSVASSQQSPRAGLQSRPVDTDMKVTMPVSALRAPRPVNGEAQVPPPLAEENPYSAPEAPSSVAMDASVADYVLAGRLARLGSAILNVVFQFLVMLPGGLMIYSQAMALITAEADAGPPDLSPLLAGLGVVGLGLLVLVTVQIVMLVKSGQTLGKKIVGIRIVNDDDGQLPSWVRSVLLREVVNMVPQFIPLVAYFYPLADALFIFRGDRRCIHDLIAGTKVVEAR